VSSKTYGQYCAMSKALDVVGERWSLLIVRELLTGPKRYVDLRDGLVSVSTDMLAARLKDLEAAGVVRRETLPPPAASKVYVLTDRGRALEPVVDELARWGLELLGDRSGEVFHPAWLERAIRSLIPRDRAVVDLVVRFELPEGAFSLHIDEHDVQQADDGTRADVVVTGDVEGLVAIANHLVETGSLSMPRGVSVDGSKAAIRRFSRLLSSSSN
jgi:DNA-binding HxlR family transcriptional regulator